MDFLVTVEELLKNEKSLVNSTEWADDWKEYYVVFADLIAFAHRCMISTGITLNNIIRFHRAINDALDGLDDVIKYQFTDACYILTKDSKMALIVASNIANECLLHNHIRMQKSSHAMFYHMIVPKIVISKGNVLVLKNLDSISSIKKIAGISSKELLAGEGIVKAYYLEKKTTGGLISVDKDYINEFKKHGHRKPESSTQKIKTNSLYKKWRKDTTNKILEHDGVNDIPWLALQPRQKRKGNLITESESTFKEKVKSFNHIWKKNFTEHMTEKTSTETLKQYGGGVSHLCELLQLYTDAGPRSWDLVDLNNAIEKI